MRGDVKIDAVGEAGITAPGSCRTGSNVGAAGGGTGHLVQPRTGTMDGARTDREHRLHGPLLQPTVATLPHRMPLDVFRDRALTPGPPRIGFRNVSGLLLLASNLLTGMLTPRCRRLTTEAWIVKGEH